jgi:hypothetical protein
MDAVEPGASAPPDAIKKTPRFACAISGKDRPRRDLISLETLRPTLADRIPADHSELAADALISRSELARYRTLYVEELLQAEHGELTELGGREYRHP